MSVRENFGGSQVYHNRRTLLQDAQKVQTSHPPNPGCYFTHPPRVCQDSLFALGRALPKQGHRRAILFYLTQGWLG